MACCVVEVGPEAGAEIEGGPAAPLPVAARLRVEKLRWNMALKPCSASAAVAPLASPDDDADLALTASKARVYRLKPVS